MDAEKFNGLTIQELKDLIGGFIGTPIPRPKPKTNREEKIIALAKQLEEANQSIINAHILYQEKGIDVEIRICRDTGLISKWKLKNKYPKRIVVGGGGVNNSVPADKTMSVQEFNSIVNHLGDGEFSSKDIQNALNKSGIGARKLQPTLGLIIKGIFGKSPIEKLNYETRGPGVRYRKVK